MFDFTNLSMNQSDGDDVTAFSFCQLGNNTEAVSVPKSTTSGVDETSVVADTKIKTGIMFADIVRGNQYHK